MPTEAEALSALNDIEVGNKNPDIAIEVLQDVMIEIYPTIAEQNN